MISFKSFIFEEPTDRAEHPDLFAMGVTKAQIDAFKKYKKVDQDYENHKPRDVESKEIPHKIKASRTRALRVMHDTVPARVIHMMHHIHDYEGMERLK